MMRKPPNSAMERGSALLIVLVFAAMVAIMLYMEMPVAVFEAQRTKEQVLIDRGNEYVRGVKLYLRKVGHYPPSLDALENTNRMRFLRKRYKDPFTGKDDWRLLHAAPNGMLTDSKVNPTGNLAGAGNMAGAGNSPLNANNKNAGNSPFSNAGNSPFSGFNSPSSSNSTSNNSPFSGFNAGLSSSTGTGEAEVVVPKIPQRPPAIAANGAANGEENGNSPASQQDPFAVINNPAAVTGSPPLSAGGSTTNPNAAPNTPQTAANGEIITPNASSGIIQPATSQAMGANPAAPSRPNATVGTGSSPLGVASTASSGLGVIQGGGGIGIAGVASKADGLTIKTYNDQENYSLWEFYYDPTKDAARNAAGALAQMGGGNQASAGNGALGSSFNSGTNRGQSFGSGSNSGTNGSSGFGSFGGGLSGMQNSSRSGFSQSPGTQNTNSGFGSFGSSGFGNSNPPPSSPPASPPQ